MLLREKFFLSLFVVLCWYMLLDQFSPHIDRFWETRNATHSRYLVREGDKVGYMNGRGRVVIPYKFADGVPYFKEGLGMARTSGGWGYIDIDGEDRILGRYVWEKPFVNGLAAVAVKNKYEALPRYGFINEKDREIIPLVYQQVRSFTPEGLAAVRVGQKWGYIDAKNKFVVPAEYEEAKDFSQGLAAVLRGGKWGYIDHIGLWIIAPQFEEVRDFHEGLAAVKSNGVWGYIDATGKWAVEPAYTDVEDFSEGLALVTGMDGFGFIDAAGNLVFHATDFSHAHSFHEGLAAVLRSPSSKNPGAGKWGYVDNRGHVAIDPQFDQAFDFEGGLARVALDQNDLRRGYINKSGQLVWDPADWLTSKNVRQMWMMLIAALLLIYAGVSGRQWRKARAIKLHHDAQKEQLDRLFKKDPSSVL